jgi:HptB-dependent secretion and biofilm anti anti-sigma factor
MQSQTVVSENIFEVRLSDRLSFSDNSAFRKLLDDMQTSKTRQWVINLAGLVSVDSAGLGMFIIAAEAAKRGGTALTLRGPTGHVRRLIELSKIDKLMNVEF